MKLCKKCSIEQPVDQFRTSWCISCTKLYDKARYRRIGKESWTRSKGTARKDRQDWLKEYKKTLKCELCSENHPACLDFHHKDTTIKFMSIGDMIHRYSLKRVQEEIAKCSVICANCHRKHHYRDVG